MDGAIHRAAGPGLLEECRKIGGCPTGEARITGGHNLPAMHVIHTVGPVYSGGTGGEPDLLRSCYLHSLQLASDNGLKTIAFPAISCGVYGYPVEDAARIAMTTTVEFLSKVPSIERVTFVLFSGAHMRLYQDLRADLIVSL